MIDSKAQHLLSCALSFQTNEITQTQIPDVFETVEEALDCMMKVLLHEAKEDYRLPIETPENPIMHPVDIDTESPGIVVQNSILRPALPMPRIRYKRRDPAPPMLFKNAAHLSMERVAPTIAQKTAKSIKKQEHSAKKELRAEMSSLEKIAKKDELKRIRESETREEKQARLSEERERRKAKKLETDAKKLDKEQVKIERKPEDKECKRTEHDDCGPQCAVDLDTALEEDIDVSDKSCNLLPVRLKAKSSNTKYYTTPIPHDRHLAALEAAWPRDTLVPSLLKAEPSDNLVLIFGPPGTGKTTALISHLMTNDNGCRIFVCAPTNVGAANVYSRMIQMNVKDCALVMAPSKVPAETIVLTQDPSARIVVSTISARSGKLLDGHTFEKVYVDEAAQVMEAWIWGLVRTDVNLLVLAGDPTQLPALVSEPGKRLNYDRSLAQRLIENHYPSEYLSTQRRMHEEIVQFVNECFYQNTLTTDYHDKHKVPEPYSIINCPGQEEKIGTSFCNKVEADACICIAKKCLQYFHDVVIIAPYQAQTRYLLAAQSGVMIHTVDSFQGREADAVVLSIVRTMSPGFWEDYRRLVVALTRAKHKLVIVGNCDLWKDKNLQLLLDNAKQRNLVTPLKKYV